MKSCHSERPAPGSREWSSRGYTLLELLLAMSLLVLLGGSLAALLGHGVRIWNTAEQSARAYEEARAVLDQTMEDLRSALVRTHSSPGGDWIRFLADADSEGRPRLRFVRTVSGEAADPILREGGRFIAGRLVQPYDGQADAEEAARGVLAAPGGHLEVMYSAAPGAEGGRMRRSVRSPAGGEGSLLLDSTVQPSGVPLSDHLLHLGFRFWAPTTNTWASTPCLKDPRGDQASGPSSWWDSTRALLETQGASGEFCWRRAPGSLDDPKDDIFPELVEVTVVVANQQESLGVRLEEEVNDKATTLLLSREIQLPENPADRFVLVDSEWMEIESATGRRLEVKAGGRGARFSKPAAHERGARAEIGLTLRRVVEMPCYRLEERSEPARRRGRRGAGR